MNTFTICDADKNQLQPSVAFNSENYIVVWSDERFIDDYYQIVAARVTPQGAVLDTGVCIGNGDDSQREIFPDIAFDGDRCLAVWSHYYAPYGVYGRFINSLGQPEGNVVPVATSNNRIAEAKVTFDGNNYLIVFSDRTDGFDNVYGQLVSADGSLIGGRIPIASDNNIDQGYPDVVWDGHFYVVVWLESAYYIKGQRLDANGQLINSSFQISNTTLFPRYFPSIAVSDTNYLVAWQEYRNSQFVIYGNVDHTVGVEEGASRPEDGEFGPTIFSGPLVLSKDKNCRVFDITGRVVMPDKIKPGIYFIEVDGEITKKVVKVR